MKPTIKLIETSAIRVRYSIPTKHQWKDCFVNTRRYKLVADKKQAADTIAWWILGDKFGALEEVKSIAGHECDCCEFDYPINVGSALDYYGCGIHNRDNGYFKRAHDKLANILLTKFCEA